MDSVVFTMLSKYRFITIKGFFDKGWNLTNYLKYVFAFAGIFDFIDGRTAIMIGCAYIASCFVLGWAWYNWNFQDVENDFNNKFNPFVRKMLSKSRKIQR